MSDKYLRYRDCTISLTDKFKFAVTGDIHFGGSNTFASMDEAKEAVDQQLKIKGIKAKRKVALTVINDFSGKLETIHGIHATRGDLLGLTESGSYNNSSDALPNVDWIAELVEERIRLHARINEIGHALRKYRIAHYRGRMNNDAHEYEEAIKVLEQEHADKTKLAQQVNDRPPVVYKVPT